MTLYHPNIDLVNDTGVNYNVYTKFGLITSLYCHDIQQKPNSDVNQGRLLCCKFATMTLYKIKVNLVNDNVYTRFGLIRSIHSQDIVYPYAYTKSIKHYKEK